MRNGRIPILIEKGKDVGKNNGVTHKPYLTVQTTIRMQIDKIIIHLGKELQKAITGCSFPA